jgi:hypothetical protein
MAVVARRWSRYCHRSAPLARPVALAGMGHGGEGVAEDGERGSTGGRDGRYLAFLAPNKSIVQVAAIHTHLAKWGTRHKLKMMTFCAGATGSLCLWAISIDLEQSIAFPCPGASSRCPSASSFELGASDDLLAPRMQKTWGRDQQLKPIYMGRLNGLPFDVNLHRSDRHMP